MLGLIGIPIFAAGGGIGYIFRPSFGYLVGFIASAFVTGKICEKLKASYKNYLLACLAGFVVTYAIGIVYKFIIATVYKGNIIKNLIMDCQSYTKYRPNETTGGIFVSWRRKEELPTGA